MPHILGFFEVEIRGFYHHSIVAAVSLQHNSCNRIDNELNIKMNGHETTGKYLYETTRYLVVNSI